MKGVLFDLDGVITDTAKLHFDAWNKLIQRHFHMALPQSIVELTKGVSRQDSLQLILKAINQEVVSEQFDLLCKEKNQLYLRALASLTEADILPGITDLIDGLKTDGIKLALASASQNAPRILQQLNLFTQFDAIVDPTTIVHGKPAPDIYLAAAKTIDLDPHACVGIEDAASGVTAIRDSGAVAIAVGDPVILKDADIVVSHTGALSPELVRTAWDNFHG